MKTESKREKERARERERGREAKKPVCYYLNYQSKHVFFFHANQGTNLDMGFN
jgi:hypothetical protein